MSFCSIAAASGPHRGLSIPSLRALLTNCVGVMRGRWWWIKKVWNPGPCRPDSFQAVDAGSSPEAVGAAHSVEALAGLAGEVAIARGVHRPSGRVEASRTIQEIPA